MNSDFSHERLLAVVDQLREGGHTDSAAWLLSGFEAWRHEGLALDKALGLSRRDASVNRDYWLCRLGESLKPGGSSTAKAELIECATLCDPELLPPDAADYLAAALKCGPVPKKRALYTILKNAVLD